MVDKMVDKTDKASTPASDEVEPGGLSDDRATSETTRLLRQESNGEPTSERVREAWDSLPGQETSVDYPKIDYPRMGTVTNLPLPTGGYLDMKDLSVDVTVMLPDGRRLCYSESLEYQLDEDGLPVNFEEEDVLSVLEGVFNATMRRFS